MTTAQPATNDEVMINPRKILQLQIEIVSESLRFRKKEFSNENVFACSFHT